MTEPSPSPDARIAGRYCVAYVLGQVRVGRAGRPFLDGLILLAIVQANIAHIDRDPELSRVYGPYDQPPPDELRRPVSVSAIAHSLRLPYETVRRRIALLARQDACAITARGVYVPTAALTTPEHRMVAEATYRNVRDLYLRLRDLGVLRDAPSSISAAAAALLDGPVPVRAVVRISADYFLRVIELLTLHIGDLTSGLILLDIVHANTEHLSEEDRAPGGVGPYIPDERRLPTPVATVAARLGLPEETARRHVTQLIKGGHCVRVSGGLVLLAENLARPPWPQLIQDNLGHVNRMFAALAPHGLLSLWESEPRRLSGAA
ncbi:hypothetical protein DJ021_01065 [Phenylobacterium hankyongense]|uniref:Uncharacterized protein n=1 Tax=Phenylobacterium hankyongense TaxID=1813876 RepID=A0A328AXR3_9CAUL|nr:hypothetical protein [Phenylobacterium hankyongense]RAK58486.1 hypothetical protein DJ021_01065 [Phenylobacterium hankyongense]